MPLPVSTHTISASIKRHNPNSPFLLTREETPSPSNKTDESDSPIPELSDEATLGITLGIVGAVVLLLLIWYLRYRSKQRREGNTRRSGVEKWDPVQGTTASPSRSWVDVDVERQALEDHGVPPRFEGNRQVHTGRVWGAPKWNAVAERMAQHGNEQREASTEMRLGGRLSEPPPAMTRRPTGDGNELRDIYSRGEPYVAMLWAPGQRGTLQ